MAEKPTKKTLVQRLKEAAHRNSFFGKVEEVAEHRRHVFNQKVKHAEERTEANRKKLHELHQHHGVPASVVEDAEQMLAIAEHHEKVMRRKREFWRRRFTWAHSRHHHWGSVFRHRRHRLRRWIQQHEGFQPYMANGKPWKKLTPEARHGIYLDFRAGLFVTSTYEGFPGDGVHASGSYHYLQNQPDGKARCWDAASASRKSMAEAQIREARRCPSFLTEMIGPENSFEYKNGIRYTLPEGDPLETMHDNHKHEDIRDGAPT